LRIENEDTEEIQILFGSLYLCSYDV